MTKTGKRPFANLRKWRDHIYMCERCGICREKVWRELNFHKVCPVREAGEEYGCESYTMRGRMMLTRVISHARSPTES